jgi:hypothetical protein
MLIYVSNRMNKTNMFETSHSADLVIVNNNIGNFYQDIETFKYSI